MVDRPVYRRLVISPHLDDAALSCGGAIHRWTTAGESVLVVTLVTADPPSGELSAFARYQHDSWKLDAGEVYRIRRSEDRCAMTRLGALGKHLGVVDCIYRGDGRGFFYNSDDELFGAIHPDDYVMVDLLIEQLSGLGHLAADLSVYVPLGLGNHVDHQLVRQAVERWRGDKVFYYEDFPYADEIQKPIVPPCCSPLVINLDQTDIQARINAIACYESQIVMLFGDAAGMKARVWQYAHRVAGQKGWAERFWKPTSNSDLNTGGR